MHGHHVLPTGLVASALLLAGCGTDSPTQPEGPAEVALSVILTGDGAGTVTSDPAGISCTVDGGTCMATFEAGTTVTLTAAPASGDDAFEGWSGACSGDGACTLTPNADASVSAEFDDTTVTTASIGTDGGTVTSPDGALELVVPPGALSAEQQITVRRVALEAVDPELIDPASVVDAFELGPDGLEFDEPVEARLRIAASEGPLEVALPFLLALSGEDVEVLGMAVEASGPDEGVLIGRLSHFSQLVHFFDEGFRFEVRGIPDMAFVGQSFTVFVDGRITTRFPPFNPSTPSLEGTVTDASTGPVEAPVSGPRFLTRHEVFKELPLGDSETTITYDLRADYTCTAPGEAEIVLEFAIDLPGESVFGVATFVLRKRLLCKAALIELSTDEIVFEHIIRESDCPQDIGSIVITNPSDQAIDWNLTDTKVSTGPDDALSAINVSANSGSLGPGESTTVEFQFNCAVQSGFLITAAITATSPDGTMQAIPFSIIGDVARAP